MRTCEGYCRHVPAEVALEAVQEDPGHVADPAHHAHAVEAGRHHHPAPAAAIAILRGSHGGFFVIIIVNVIVNVIVIVTVIVIGAEITFIILDTTIRG